MDIISAIKILGDGCTSDEIAQHLGYKNGRNVAKTLNLMAERGELIMRRVDRRATWFLGVVAPKPQGRVFKLTDACRPATDCCKSY